MAWATAIIAAAVAAYLLVPTAGEFHVRVSMPLPPQYVEHVPGGLKVVAAPSDPFSRFPGIEYRVFSSTLSNITPAAYTVLGTYLRYVSVAYSATHDCAKAAEMLSSRVRGISASLAERLCRGILRDYETAPTWMKKLSLVQVAYFNLSPGGGVIVAVVYPGNGTVLFTRLKDYASLATWIRGESYRARVGVVLNAWYSFSMRKYLESLANETEVFVVVPVYKEVAGEDAITRLAEFLGLNCTVNIIVNGRAVPRLDYDAYYAVLYKGAVVKVYDDPRCLNGS